MATVNKQIADEVIARNGKWDDDPQVYQVVEYESVSGSLCYAILYKQDVAINRYRPSPYVNNPRVIWEWSGHK